MKYLKLIAAAFALTVATGSIGQTADMDQIIPDVQEDAYVPVEVGNGWYLRGDVGYNFGAKHNTDIVDTGLITYDYKFRDKLAFGGGFGYQLNEFLRVDATFDKIFKTEFNSNALIAPSGPCNGLRFVPDPFGGGVWVPSAITNCLQGESVEYKAWMMMANAYADLGTYAGFTPFIGAGVGAARIKWREETDSITCVPISPSVAREVCSAVGSIDQPLPNEIYTQPGTMVEGTDWRLAYSLSAGLAYDLTQNLKLETSYKFSGVGKSGSDMPSTTTTGSNLAADGFTLHQVKVGLRYKLW